MKLSLAFLLVPALLALPACGGCPEGEGCAAVTKLEASFRGAPECLTVTRTEPDNRCICYGDFTVMNACDVGVTIGESEFGPLQVIRAGGVTTLMVDNEAEGPHHVEVGVQSPNKSFTLEVDYTIEHRDIEGCSLGGVGQATRPGAGRAAGLLGLLGLLVGRRRRVG